MTPFFSIIIPCYNQAHFLCDCINSLLEQDYKNWEAIVVNDGSLDNTSDIVKSYSLKDSRIRLVDKLNGGLSSARNKGINSAVGNYIIFLDADDLIINNCLSKYERLIIDHKFDFVQSGYQCFRENSNDILFKRSNIPKYDDFLKSILRANIGPVNGFVVSKNLINKVGNFNESLTSCEDWDFWIRCAKAGFSPFVHDEILAAYRYVPGSMGKNSLRMLEQGLRVINFHHLNLDSTEVDLEKLENNKHYYNATIEYLIFTVGIALFNNQQNQFATIKQNYFEKLSVKIDVESLNRLSNYQTYRNFNILEYTIFYYRSSKVYYDFFNFLLKKKLIDDKGKIYFKTILPNPKDKIFKRIKNKKFFKF